MPKQTLGMTLYTMQEAADILGVSISVIRKARRDGRLEAEKIDRRWYFTHKALREFVRRKISGKKLE